MKRPATPPPGRKRKATPVAIKLRSALRAAGIDPDQPHEYQHEPPLGVRPFDPDIDDYIPAENDDRHIRPMQKAEHKKVTKEVDRPAIDKTRRLAKAQEAHAEVLARLANKVSKKAEKKSRWPKRKMRSKPFGLEDTHG